MSCTSDAITWLPGKRSFLSASLKVTLHIPEKIYIPNCEKDEEKRVIFHWLRSQPVLAHKRIHKLKLVL